MDTNKKLSVSSKNMHRMQLFTFLVAIELLMSFSFLGYIHIEPISVTLSYIPVLIAGCLLGPLYSAALGAVFGAASLWKASAFYVSAGDRIFSPFLSDTPIESLLLSVGARLLFGAAAGILYWAAKHSPKYQLFWIAAVSFFGKLIHSIFVYGAMGLFFPELGRGPAQAFRDGFTPGELTASLLIAVLVTTVWKIWTSQRITRYRRYTETRKKYLGGQSHKKVITSVVVLLLFLTAMIGFYFIDRIKYMLSVHGISLSEAASHDLTHLQLQFLFGMIALFLIVHIVSRDVHDYISYIVYHSMSNDPLTELLNRKGFSNIFQRLAQQMRFSEDLPRYFLILDIDYFKEINDSCGHLEGDRILREVAGCLKQSLNDIGIVGRMGGDEFVAFIHTPLSRDLFEARIQRLMRDIGEIECDKSESVSCSIGIVPVTESPSEKKLYLYADQALYRAKRAGRNRYNIAPAAEKKPAEPKSGAGRP